MEAGKVAWEVGRNGVRIVLEGGAEDKVKTPSRKGFDERLTPASFALGLLFSRGAFSSPGA